MKKFIAFTAVTLPGLVLAADLGTLLQSISTWIGTLRNIVIALAILAFFWGLVVYIWNAHDEGKRKDGRQFMIWAVVAIAVMFSIYGLVQVLQSTFGIQSTTTLPAPQLPQ